MRLGIVQMRVADDVAADIARAEEGVAWVAAAGADLAVLPEMFCCPYDSAAFPAHAEPAGGRVWRALSGMAARNGVWLVGGSMPERDGERVYNTSFCFAPDGAQVARHRKEHLFDVDIEGGQRFRESETLSAGEGATAFETPWGAVGVAVCFDARFPETFRAMVARGVRLALVPAAFNMTTGPAHWELTLRMRAVDNQMFCVGVAPARDASAGYVSYAHSLVADPWGRVVADLGEGETVRVVDLDLGECDRVRAQLPFVSALQP